MHDEGKGLKELTHKPDFDLGSITVITAFTFILHMFLYGNQSEKE